MKNNKKIIKNEIEFMVDTTELKINNFNCS